MKQRIGHLARDHVGLVCVGQGDNDIGVIRTGAIEHLGIGGMPDDGANVEPVLQLAQHVGPHVDDRDFVGFFARQMISRGRTDLACAENENFHCSCQVSEQPKALLQGASLHEIEIRIAQNEPFCAGCLKIDFHARMGALPLAIQDNAVAKLAVANALAKADAEFGAGRCRARLAGRRAYRPRHLHARSYLLDIVVRYLRDKS